MPEVPSWIETLGRAGHVAKGVVYFIIGFLAFKLAIGAGGEISGSREAIREIGRQPFGRVMLGCIAIGLLGYTAWRIVQAAKNTDGDGTDAKGVLKRIGYVISGIAYFSLGTFAGSLAIGWGEGANDDGSGTAGFLIATTWGRVVLGLVGLVTVGVALYFIYKAYLASFMTKYDFGAMSETARTVALHAGRVGLTTRAIAFAIIGGFLLVSAVYGTGDRDIAGIEDALALIASQTYGKVLIGITGFGLMCYAVHMFLMARYRRFNVV
ncbi:DUF1206 domain-containing protein [Aporhodopirellula aestuarii]|uniref:DUF1206 domain-containing protein n=1 Tax=Aporhodopirellula aestuarii TaxID=2950107 RepID=A0ABT0U9K6_9BACT|nr:DUF1206 domain-containing protein [Aporhodopirellula aestuarii]MCM2373663.1 DUF1206 domain-containing protein [Aporhodopirellula aestuarii]